MHSTSRSAIEVRSPYERRRPHDALNGTKAEQRAEQEYWAEVWENGEDADD